MAILSPMVCPNCAPVQEDSFHLVDNRPTQKNKGQRRFNPQRFAHRNTQFNRGQPEQPHQARQKQQKQRQFQNFHRDNQRVIHTCLYLAARARQICSKLQTLCSSCTQVSACCWCELCCQFRASSWYNSSRSACASVSCKAAMHSSCSPQCCIQKHFDSKSQVTGTSIQVFTSTF